MFRNDPNTDSVSLDFSPSVIDACCEGIYTGTVPLNEDVVQDILLAADYLGLEDLMQQATEFIILHLDDSNCLDVLAFAIDQGNKKMESSAAAFIASNLTTDPENHQELYTVSPTAFKMVLESNKLVVKEKSLGIVITGLARELCLVPFIEKFCISYC